MHTIARHRAIERRTVLRGAALLAVATLAGGQAPRPTTVRDDLQAVFAANDTRGTFALLDVVADALTVVDAARAAERRTPASTFKIANSLIALETGVVADENEPVPYGGKPQPIKAWERDMGLREAIALSNVPVYQEIARRVGLERYAAWLARLDYGNRETGPGVDRFWLDGPLAISPIEQARFVGRLATRKLDVSQRSQAIVRAILRQSDEAGGAKLFAKTGWLTSAKPQVGWWTGWVEREGAVHAFSLNMDVASPDDLPKRLAVTKALLRQLGVLPPA